MPSDRPPDLDLPTRLLRALAAASIDEALGAGSIATASCGHSYPSRHRVGEVASGERWLRILRCVACGEQLVGPLAKTARPRHVKLDISFEETLALEPLRRTVHVGFSDQQGLGVQILVYAIEEVLAEKLRSLLQRREPRDLVPGGGPSPDGSSWVNCRRGYLLPVRALSVLFRGKLLGALDRALTDGKVVTPPDFDARRALRKAARKKWNVYSKPSFVGPEHVIRYLGKYTHRIAISNGRLLAYEAGEVTFRYADRSRERSLTMTLPADQFLRRFLSHVLPPGFVRIRYFGGLANATREWWLSQCRELLAATGVQNS